MTPKYAIVAALIVVVIIVIIVYTKKSEKFTPKPVDASIAAGLRNPRTVMSRRIDAARGSPDAKPLVQSRLPRMGQYFNPGLITKPEDISRAERALWFEAAERDNIAPYNTEEMFDNGTDAMQHHKTAPAADYSTLITDIVVDPRTRQNHEMWTNEMKGWSGTTTMKVDDLEMENYLDFQGLARPQAGVTIYNPMMLTEIDNSDLARNKPFHFNG